MANNVYTFTAECVKGTKNHIGEVWIQQGSNHWNTYFHCKCKNGTIHWSHSMPDGHWKCPAKNCRNEYDIKVTYPSGMRNKIDPTGGTLADLTKIAEDIKGMQLSLDQKIRDLSRKVDRATNANNEALTTKLEPICGALRRLEAAPREPPQVPRHDLAAIVNPIQRDIHSLEQAVAANTRAITTMTERNPYPDIPGVDYRRPPNRRNDLPRRADSQGRADPWDRNDLRGW